MYILENPLYVGTLRWRKETEHYFEVEDSVPPIIEQETFKQTQLLREARKHSPPRTNMGVIFFRYHKVPLLRKVPSRQLRCIKNKIWSKNKI